MKNLMHFSIVLLCLLLSACQCEQYFSETSHNPIISVEGLADPTVIKVGSTYYLYPTSDGKGYDVYTSQDLKNWQKGNRVFSHDAPNVWAPDVYHDVADDKFYLYYTVNFKIGVAVADSPLGPFEDQGALIKGIDAHLYRDDDGELYLYYVEYQGSPVKTNPMKAVKMDSPLLVSAEEPVDLFRADTQWEITFMGFGVTEGPWMLKHKGLYYLMYSGNFFATCQYNMGYATSESPMGPFIKYEGNPLLCNEETGVVGPGHHSVIENPEGELVMIYHQKGSKAFRLFNSNDNRYVAMDPMGFNEDGSIWVDVTPLNLERM